MKNAEVGGNTHALKYFKGYRGFSVTESIIMLAVLAVFTLIIIALLIYESAAIKDNGQKGVLNPPVEIVP